MATHSLSACTGSVEGTHSLSYTYATATYLFISFTVLAVLKNISLHDGGHHCGGFKPWRQSAAVGLGMGEPTTIHRQTFPPTIGEAAIMIWTDIGETCAIPATFCSNSGINSKNDDLLEHQKHTSQRINGEMSYTYFAHATALEEGFLSYNTRTKTPLTFSLFKKQWL